MQFINAESYVEYEYIIKGPTERDKTILSDTELTNELLTYPYFFEYYNVLYASYYWLHSKLMHIKLTRIFSTNIMRTSLRRDVWPSGLVRWLVNFEPAVVGSNPGHG